MDQTASKTGPAGWLKWFIILALLLLVLGATIWLLPGSSQVQRRIDALKKAGYPVTAQDLEKMYPPLPDGQNSAVIYEKAFLRCLPLPGEHDNWPIVGTSKYPFRTHQLPPEIKQGIAGYVDQNESALALLHQAAGIEKGYYDNDFKFGFSNGARPFSLQILQSVELLALANVLCAEERQPAAATQFILDSLGLSRSLEHDPQLSSLMIRDTIVHLSCSSLELTLNKTPLSDEELRSLSPAFHEAEPSDGLKQALFYERCQGIGLRDLLTSNPFSRPSEPLGGKLRDLYFSALHYRDGDFILYLDMWEKLVAATELPSPRRLEVARQLTSQVKESKQNERTFGVLFVEWDKSFLIDAKTRALLLLSETALAIERYHLANHDQLPASLQDLVPAYLPAIPADPFDGKPLRYNHLPKGYLLYSIGEDGVDNGGAEWNTTNETGDITFTVER